MPYIICMLLIKSFRLSASIVAITLVGVIGFIGCARVIKSERLGTLLELKKEDELLSEALEREGKNFEALRDMLREGEIKKGDSSDSVKAKAGVPVIVYSEETGEKWVYKTAGGTRLSGPKIYLFFDLADALSNYECIRTEC